VVVVPVRTLTSLTKMFWVAIMGVVGLFAFFLGMGAVTPADDVVLTAIVVVLAIALAAHLMRVRHAMHEHGHEAEMRELHKMRETRGF
jgi:hypothetical protein